MNQLEFQKGTMIGNVTYRQVNTTVSISDTVLHIVKRTKKIFRHEKIEDRDFVIANITLAKVRTVLDFWDTLYAIIATILGFFNPLLFILALVCLWCGYGKIIELNITTGERYQIPVKGSAQEIEILLSTCNSIK